MEERIFGKTWEEVQAMQQRKPLLSRPLDLGRVGDYGADPLGDGRFRMVPSGDVVDLEERNIRLRRRG